MEVSPFVNLKYVSEFLEGEIKQISERWGQFMINKIALERVLNNERDSTEAQMKDYELVKDMLAREEDLITAVDTRTPAEKVFSDIDISVRLNYEHVLEHENRKKSLETANKGLKEFEEFLEVATELKKEIDNKMKK